MPSLKRAYVMIPLLILISVLSLFITPGIGITWISPLDILHNNDLRYIFFSIRIPRTLTAFFAGGGLAIAGMIYQAIFRNPLACPHILGVSSGASLGAALCIVAGAAGSVYGLPIVTFGAFTGAVLSVLIVCLFAWSYESNSSTLLLAGVVVATVCSGLIMFIHLIGGIHKSFQILRWIMGGVDGVSYPLLILMLAPLMVFFGITAVLTPRLDLFLTGDDIAHSRGINVRASRNILIISTALAVGAVVAACGPIGFVGIIAPHACRMMIPGIRHRLLSLCSFLLGGTFLVLADTLARSLAPPAEIPVGIITSLLGGPFFLIVLARRKKRYLM
ncbi:Iron(III) dicitrate transport system permease protein FecD [Chitinispirillum alkaliphilum]|nr:Iron(III) dicitrate transport system permease protein FecD [Chitinispirillum alkaliphilum]